MLEVEGSVGDVCNLEAMAGVRVTTREGWRLAGVPRQKTFGPELWQV